MYHREELAFEEVLSAADIAGIALQKGEYFDESGFASLKEVEYLDGDLFFTAVTGTRNTDEDIGWRYGYNRGETYVYRKDLTTGQIELLYSY